MDSTVTELTSVNMKSKLTPRTLIRSHLVRGLMWRWEMREELFALEDDNPCAETIRLIDANAEEVHCEVAECISEVNDMVMRLVHKNLHTS